MDFELSEIVEESLKIIRAVQKEAQEEILSDPASAFEPALLGRRKKPLLTIDLLAEAMAAMRLRRRLKHYDLLAVGEERLRDPSLDLSAEQRLVVLMDMIDGTDLLLRGLSNWCSAMVFYYPPQRRILASFVAIPSEYIYFAREDIEKSYKCSICGKADVLEVRGPSSVQRLDSASLAFYGQKVANFLSVARHEGFISGLTDLHRNCAREKRELKTRMYNLAGNPMMMRLIDGHSRVDAVFDLEGQAPHDVVPGAYIAKKANAVFCDLEGKPVDLGKPLLRPADPSSRMRYILTSTEDLSLELRKLLTNNQRKGAI